MALFVSLTGIIDREVYIRSKDHHFIICSEMVKAEGSLLMNEVIAKYEFKFLKKFDDFNVLEKHEAENEFQSRMDPIYKKHHMIPIRKGVI